MNIPLTVYNLIDFIVSEKRIFNLSVAGLGKTFKVGFLAWASFSIDNELAGIQIGL